MTRLLPAVLIVVVGVVAAMTLAEHTMSRDHAVDPGTRMAVTIDAATKGGTFFSELQMTRSLFLACRLEVDAKVVSEAFEVRPPGSYRFVIRPALDESDRRQLHGCLEDARIDQLQLDVVGMERIPPDDG